MKGSCPLPAKVIFAWRESFKRVETRSNAGARVLSGHFWESCHSAPGQTAAPSTLWHRAHRSGTVASESAWAQQAPQQIGTQWPHLLSKEGGAARQKGPRRIYYHTWTCLAFPDKRLTILEYCNSNISFERTRACVCVCVYNIVKKKKKNTRMLQYQFFFKLPFICYHLTSIQGRDPRKKHV